jgi:2-keto-4-pentenoate hydratase
MPELIRPKDLIALRAHGRSRPVTASELPQTVAAAYDVAAATLGLLGTQAAGWKLGATTAGTRRTFATDEIYFGALGAEEIWDSAQSASPPAPPSLRGEAEIAFRLAVDVRCEDTNAALQRSPAELFDAWAPAIEAPYTCVDNIPEAGLRALLMDRCAAGALYLGEPRQDIDDPAIDQTLEILVDGACVAKGAAHNSLLMTPVEAARGFLRVAAPQGVDVKRGQWISTGGITPCVTLPFGQAIQLNLAGAPVLNLIVQAPIS